MNHKIVSAAVHDVIDRSRAFEPEKPAEALEAVSCLMYDTMQYKKQSLRQQLDLSAYTTLLYRTHML